MCSRNFGTSGIDIALVELKSLPNEMNQTTSMEPRTNMNRITQPTFVAAALAALVLGLVGDAFAQSYGTRAYETPETRMQPIGAPSRVDRYRSDTRRPDLNRQIETEYRSSVASHTQAIPTSYRQPASYNQASLVDPNVRQTVLLQQGGFPLPPGQVPSGSPAAGSPFAGSSPPTGFSAPPPVSSPSSTPAALPSPATAPNSFAPAPRSSLPPNLPIASTLDYQPIPQPQLGNTYATVDNCSCISPPSGYTAASVGCGSPVNYAAPGYAPATGYAPTTGYIAPPSQIAAPFAAPGQFTAISGNAAPLPSLFTLGQQNNPVQVGQGIIGQPVAYVPGQTIRNFFRYLFP